MHLPSKRRSLSAILGEDMKTISIVALAALALAACQQPAETKAPAEAAKVMPAGAAAAVDTVAALSVLERCGADASGISRPVLSHVVDLGGGVFAVLMDCQSAAGEQTLQTVHVQGTDGVLKYQPLLIYNGAGYEPDYTWEGTQSAPLTWDATTSQLVSVYKTSASPAVDGQGAVKASEATIRWRWAGDQFAMVSSTYAVQDAPGGPFVVNATWPTTPPTEDPTAALQPVAPQA